MFAYWQHAEYKENQADMEERKNYDSFSDEELIAMLRKGEEPVEEYLMNKYKVMVRKKARSLYLEGGDTEDLLQEGMWGLFKAVREYRPDKDAAFRTFADLCVTRQMYTAIATAKQKKYEILNRSISLSGIDDDSEDVYGKVLAGPEDLFFEKEAADELLRKIKEILSPMENRVLELYLTGMDYHEIAGKLGKKEKSIDNALQRIKNKIRAQ